MTPIHIYARGHQPATRFVTVLGTYEKPSRHWTHIKPQAWVPTSCCRRRRWARYCTVQVYYDMLPFWCKPGRGCKKGNG